MRDTQQPAIKCPLTLLMYLLLTPNDPFGQEYEFPIAPEALSDPVHFKLNGSNPRTLLTSTDRYSVPSVNRSVPVILVPST